MWLSSVILIVRFWCHDHPWTYHTVILSTRVLIIQSTIRSLLGSCYTTTKTVRNTVKLITVKAMYDFSSVTVDISRCRTLRSIDIFYYSVNCMWGIVVQLRGPVDCLSTTSPYFLMVVILGSQYLNRLRTT